MNRKPLTIEVEDERERRPSIKAKALMCHNRLQLEMSPKTDRSIDIEYIAENEIEAMEDCRSHADLSFEAIYRTLLDRQRLNQEINEFLNEREETEGREEVGELPIDSFVSLYSEEKVNRRFMLAKRSLMQNWRPLPREEEEYEMKN